MKTNRAQGRLALALALLGAASCQDLPDRPENVCGNATIEAGEDCDTHDAGEGTHCAPPGSPRPCRWLCEPQASATRASGGTLVSGNQGDGAPKAGLRCPVGLGCGLDGVCRAPSTRFAEAGEPLGVLHERLDAGDFDGDGLADVLALTDYDSQARRTARLAFSSSTGARAVFSLPTLVSSLLIDDIDGDRRADLLFTHGDGFSALLGQQGRALEPVAYPTAEIPATVDVRLFSADADPRKIGDEFFGVLFLGGDASLANFDGVDDLSAVNFIAPLGKLAPGDAIFPPSFGRLGAEPCPTLALTLVARRELLLWATCKADKQSTLINDQPPTSLPLPPGVEPAGVQLADTDGDGHDDVILPAEGKLWVALGDGKGGVLAGAGGPWAATPLPAGAGAQRPLAVRDLNADGRIDLVMPDRLLVSTPGEGGYRVAFEREGTPWTDALVLDLNANGSLDVAAASSEGFDVDFLLQASNGLFTRVSGRSAGPVSMLTAGDFDGDDVADVAFISDLRGNREAAGAGGEAGADDPRTDAVEIAYGRPLTSPEPPTQVARLAGVQAINAGRIGRGTDRDNATELVAIQSTPRAIMLFQGSGERQLLAPYVFRNGSITARSIALATAKLLDDTPDIIALGREPGGQLRLWSAEAFETGAASLTYSAPLPKDMLAGVAALGDRQGALVAAAELAPGQGVRVVVVTSLGETPGVGLLVARLDGGAFELGALQTADAALSQDSKLLLRDIDGDGQVEVILATGSAEAPGELLVFRGDGGLGLTQAVRPSIAGGVAAAACRRDDRGGCQLFVINEGGTYRVPPPASLAGQVERVADLPGGKAITAADFDGDGLEDLAIGDGNQIRFFRTVPVLP